MPLLPPNLIKSASDDYGACVPTESGCDTDYTFNINVCHETTKSCGVNKLKNLDAKTGTRTYNANDNNYGACTITACEVGYVKGGTSSCDVPADNKYADSSGSEQTCDGSAVIANMSKLGGQAVAVVSDTRCPFTCSAGFVINKTARSCDVPGSGKYANSKGIEKSCNGSVNDIANSLTLGGEAVAVADYDSCPFTCKASYVKEERTCRPPREVLSLAAGRGHTCALLDGGNVKCWGLNGSGQLGLGDNNGRGDDTGEMGHNLPKVNLNDADNTVHTAQSLAVGGYHTCAILDDGSVKCWGFNYNGQLGLGDGKKADSYNTPQAVNLGTNSLTSAPYTAQSLAAGDNHTCAILDDGSVRCWGRNTNGQLGLGHTTNQSASQAQAQNTPQAVNLGTNSLTSASYTAESLALGGDHTCAILDDGSVKCWGNNPSGQLGLGHTTNQNSPQTVNSLGTSVQSLAGGEAHTCALLDNGSVKCWGNNTSGQLGLGNTTGQNTPQAVGLGTDRTARKLFLGNRSACVVLDNDEVKCWGENGGGHLGQGNRSVLDMNEFGITHAEVKDSNKNFGNEAGETVSTLPAINLGTDQTTGNAHTAISLAIGEYHICAILDNGSVKCWGHNSYGQLGQGNKTTFASSGDLCRAC